MHTVKHLLKTLQHLLQDFQGSQRPGKPYNFLWNLENPGIWRKSQKKSLENPGIYFECYI